MNRRSLLSSTCVLGIPYISGCVRNSSIISDGNEDAERPGEHMCPEPSIRGRRLQFAARVLSAPVADPFVEDAYSDRIREVGADPDDETRFNVITERDRERLQLDAVYEYDETYNDDDREFFEDTDLGSSILLTFDAGWQGNQRFEVSAVELERNTIRAYLCRFGDPTPDDHQNGEYSGGLETVFIRVDDIGAASKAELSYSKVPIYGDEVEENRYSTNIVS